MILKPVPITSIWGRVQSGQASLYEYNVYNKNVKVDHFKRNKEAPHEADHFYFQKPKYDCIKITFWNVNAA